MWSSLHWIKRSIAWTWNLIRVVLSLDEAVVAATIICLLLPVYLYMFRPHMDFLFHLGPKHMAEVEPGSKAKLKDGQYVVVRGAIEPGSVKDVAHFLEPDSTVFRISGLAPNIVFYDRLGVLSEAGHSVTAKTTKLPVIETTGRLYAFPRDYGGTHFASNSYYNADDFNLRLYLKGLMPRGSPLAAYACVYFVALGESPSPSALLRSNLFVFLFALVLAAFGLPKLPAWVDKQKAKGRGKWLNLAWGFIVVADVAVIVAWAMESGSCSPRLF